ncbi:MAG: TraB/GumN family protein [Halanaerobiaceae bacterium]
MHWRRIMLVTILLVILTVPIYAKNQTGSFAWEISDEENTIYVMGSIHFMPEGTFPLSESVEEAFADSEKLIVQANLLEVEEEELNNYYRKEGFYEDGQTLSDSLSESVFSQLKEELSDLNIPLSGVDQFQPWHMAQTLETQKISDLDYSLDLSVELYFLEKAQEDGKEIIELEPYLEQLDFVSNFSPELQEKYLQSILLEFEEDGDRLYKILDAWEKGEREKMEETLFGVRNKKQDLENFYHKYYDERNKKMAEEIENIMDEGEQTFVVLGAEHLVGKDNVLEFFRDKEHEIKQIK